MIIGASVLYFDEKKYDNVIDLINNYKNIEIHEEDKEQGKMVITIEAENNKEIEKIEEDFRSKDFIVDLAHFAFHFEDEVEKVLSGGDVPDFNINKPFTRKRFQ